MPSLTEGFGLPLLEAMRCGAPVLGSERTSIPEVVGNPDLLFDPTDVNDLASKLALILTHDGFRERAIAHGALQEKKFSWQWSSEIALAAFEDAVRRKRAVPQPSRQRPQYMLIPPVQPDGETSAGVARLASSLSEHGDVTVNAVDARVVTNLIDAGVFAVPPNIWQLGKQRRRVIISPSGSLDRYQETILQSVPAVIVSFRPDATSTSRERRYLAGGYAAVSTGGSSLTPSSEISLEAHAQVLAWLQDGPNVACDIEAAYRDHSRGVILRLLAEIPPLEPHDRIEVAVAATENHPAGPQRLLVDISELVHRDAGTGVQRVVRNVLWHLLRDPSGFRVEPVFRDGSVYRFARGFTCRFLGIESLGLPDGIVDFRASDVFLGLDLDALIGTTADTLSRLRRRGGSVNFVAYDFLPLLRPEWFVRGMDNAFEDWIVRMSQSGNRIIGISRAVADDAVKLLDQVGRLRASDPIEVTWFHIGSDYNISAAFGSADVDSELSGVISAWNGRPVFLTVGTIEPRKGIDDLMDAADDLWRDHDAVFVIVGKKGWLVDDLANRITQHPEHGKRLFWFASGVSDQALESLYAAATATVLPSRGEGFGLPLVEGARHGTPIVARDIPVFREIGGEGVYSLRSKQWRGSRGRASSLVGLASWWARTGGRIKLLSWQESTENYSSDTRTFTVPAMAPGATKPGRNSSMVSPMRVSEFARQKQMMQPRVCLLMSKGAASSGSTV